MTTLQLQSGVIPTTPQRDGEALAQSLQKCQPALSAASEVTRSNSIIHNSAARGTVAGAQSNILSRTLASAAHLRREEGGVEWEQCYVLLRIVIAVLWGADLIAGIGSRHVCLSPGVEGFLT
jgi:hypothetical protein